MPKIAPGTVCRIRNLTTPPWARRVESYNGEIVIEIKKPERVKQGTPLVIIDSFNRIDVPSPYRFRTLEQDCEGEYLLVLWPDGDMFIVRDSIITARME